MLPFSLFKSKTKSPYEIVKSFRNAVSRLDTADKKGQERTLEECAKLLATLKTMALGDASSMRGFGEHHVLFHCFLLDGEPNPESLAQLAQEAYSNSLLEMIVANLGRFEFETRKDATALFNALVRRQIGTRTPTVEYICSHETILISLVRGYEKQDLALNYGLMLRECLRHEALAQILLNSPEVYRFFDYVQLPTFDIASDAFATMKDLLTKHKMLVASFLLANFEQFFAHFSLLLGSENYVTRRQSLKLLGEIMLDRANFDIMTKYIANAENLKLMMNLLRDKSKNIQYEAFHVFKIFVANPNKNKPVYDILLKNQRKLIEFLEAFHPGRDDEQFAEEKRFLIQQIQDLCPNRREHHPQLS